MIHSLIPVDLVQNYISQSALRDITSLRQDFFSSLSSLGFTSSKASASSTANVNSTNLNLVKAIIVGGLYPRVARIALPTAQFERLQQGTIQKDHHAKEVKFFDQNGRVFLHPTSVLFGEAGVLKSGFVTYFAKAETSKVFLRDATEVCDPPPDWFVRYEASCGCTDCDRSLCSLCSSSADL